MSFFIFPLALTWSNNVTFIDFMEYLFKCCEGFHVCLDCVKNIKMKPKDLNYCSTFKCKDQIRNSNFVCCIQTKARSQIIVEAAVVKHTHGDVSGMS